MQSSRKRLDSLLCVQMDQNYAEYRWQLNASVGNYQNDLCTHKIGECFYITKLQCCSRYCLIPVIGLHYMTYSFRKATELRHVTIWHTVGYHSFSCQMILRRKLSNGTLLNQEVLKKSFHFRKAFKIHNCLRYLNRSTFQLAVRRFTGDENDWYNILGRTSDKMCLL